MLHKMNPYKKKRYKKHSHKKNNVHETLISVGMFLSGAKVVELWNSQQPPL